MSELCELCEKYVSYYLNTDRNGFDKRRIDRGFWATIREVNDERWLLNNILTADSAFRLRMPVHIDMRSGKKLIGRFWFYGLAEKRDMQSNKELRHFWIDSGAHMQHRIPICCELANITSEKEATSWERENLG